MPTNHNDACLDSKCLCDQVLEAINKKAPEIERRQGDNYCDLWAARKFAYISHSTRKPHLNIWFLGSADEAKLFGSLRIKPKSQTHGNWNNWGGSFTVQNAHQAEQAANLLHKISYPVPTA